MAEALAEVRTGRVEALLLDLNLPDSTGVTTFLRLQPRATGVPIVVLVAPQEEDLGKQSVERGALDYLLKGEVTAQLVDKVLRYATERTHTLKALKASEQRYRELFQNVTAGVFQTTVDGKFMAANPALVRMLGYDTEDDLLAVDVARDVYADPDHRDHWVKAMAEHGEVRNAELVLRRKDGTRLVVLENSRAVRDSDGKVLFCEGTLTDITAAHALSEQLSHDASHESAHRSQEPARLRDAPAARARDVSRGRRDARGVLHGPRPLQGRRRHLRARGGRRAAAAARSAAAHQGAHGGRGGPARRRRVRAAAARLRAFRRPAGRERRAQGGRGLPVRVGPAGVPASA